MSYLGTCFLNGVGLGAAPGNIRLDVLEREIYQQVLNMTPEQRKKAVKNATKLYRGMSPAAKKYAQQLRRRTDTMDPRSPTGLGTWGANLAAVVQSLTAVAGAYMAYEGYQDQKDSQDAQQREASKEAALARRIMEEELARKTEERKLLAAAAEARSTPQPTAQPGAAPAAPSKTGTYLAVGVAAAAAVGAAVLLKG